MKSTKKQIFERKLFKIGYSVKGEFPNSFIFNNKNQNTGIRVLSDKIEYRFGSEEEDDCCGIYIYYHKIHVGINEQKTSLTIMEKRGAYHPGVFIKLYKRE